MKTLKPFSRLFLLVATIAAVLPVPCRGAEPGTVRPDDRARLADAEWLLASPEASDRLAAAHAVASLAGRYRTLPAELEHLLYRSSGDADPEVSDLATRVLGKRERPAEPEPGSDEGVRARAEARRLEWAAEVLSGDDPETSASDRLAATHVLAGLASQSRHWSPDLDWLVREARRQADPEVARLGEALLAKHEKRPIEGLFARPPSRSLDGSGQSESARRAEAAFAGARHPDPRVRLASLHWVVDVALSEGLGSDPRLGEALSAARADPDPRVASLARSASARAPAGPS